MTSKDTLQRFIFDNSSVRGEVIQLTDTYQSIIDQHGYPPFIQKLLGEALCVAGLLAAIIKFNGRLTLQFRGNGALKFLLAQCDNQFNMRGLVKWEKELSEETLIDSFSNGVLSILLDADNHKKNYQGTVPWLGTSLSEAVEGYFNHSEQLATRIWLTVGERSAGGLLLQVIPGKDMSPGLELESEGIKQEWRRLTNINPLLNPRDMLELSREQFLINLYPEDEVRVFPAVSVKFGCTCSRERGEAAISLLGQDEAEEELKDKQVLEVTCEFCNRAYTYDKVDVAKIFAGKQPPSDTHLH